MPNPKNEASQLTSMFTPKNLNQIKINSIHQKKQEKEKRKAEQKLIRGIVKFKKEKGYKIKEDEHKIM